MRRARRLLIPNQSRRPMPEPVVPMINVVFLLLIFFLMTARIAPQPPFPISLPPGTGEAPTSTSEVFLAADGTIALGTLRGDEAIARAAQNPGPITVTADRNADATQLARLLAQLAAQGKPEVDVTVTGAP